MCVTAIASVFEVTRDAASSKLRFPVSGSESHSTGRRLSSSSGVAVVGYVLVETSTSAPGARSRPKYAASSALDPDPQNNARCVGP